MEQDRRRAEDKNADHSEDIGALKSEVHTLNSLVREIFDLIKGLQPQPLRFNNVVGGGVAVLTIFALLFGSVIYIANSANAPILAQMKQLTTIVDTMNSATVTNNSLIQLSNQKVEGLYNKVLSNEETINWFLYQENIPKQLTESLGRINTLEMQMERVVNQAHKGK